MWDGRAAVIGLVAPRLNADEVSPSYGQLCVPGRSVFSSQGWRSCWHGNGAHNAPEVLLRIHFCLLFIACFLVC